MHARSVTAFLLSCALAGPIWANPIKVVVETPVGAPGQGSSAGGGVRGNSRLVKPGVNNVGTLRVGTVLPSPGKIPVPVIKGKGGEIAPAEVEIFPAEGGQVEAVELPGEEERTQAKPAGEEAPASAPKVGGAAFQKQLGEISERHEALKDGKKNPDASSHAGAGITFDGAGELVQGRGEPVAFGRRPVSSRATLERSPVDAELSRFKREGVAVLPAGALMPVGARERALAAVAKRRAGAPKEFVSSWDLYDERKKWLADPGARPDGGGGLREFVESLTARLRGALPGEEFDLRDAHLRMVEGEVPAGDKIHIDLGGYITVTVALEGPGTVLYSVVDGVVKVRETAEREVVIATNLEREHFTDVPGSVHSAPRRVVDKRAVLILRYKPKGVIPDDVKRELLRELRSRAERVEKQLARQEAAESGSSSKPGGFGAWLKALW